MSIVEYSKMKMCSGGWLGKNEDEPNTISPLDGQCYVQEGFQIVLVSISNWLTDDWPRGETKDRSNNLMSVYFVLSYDFDRKFALVCDSEL